MNNRELQFMSVAVKLFLRHGYKKVTMSDIAEELEISRPTLYAVFSNKDEIFKAVVNQEIEAYEAATQKLLLARKGYRETLEGLFEIWIINPYASAIDSPNGWDMLVNGATYAPEPVAAIYVRFEGHLLFLLQSGLRKKIDLPVEDVAHVLTLATRGLKTSTTSVKELRRIISGLVAMTIASID